MEPRAISSRQRSTSRQSRGWSTAATVFMPPAGNHGTLLNDGMLRRDKIGHFAAINEVAFILARCPPFGASARFEKRFHVIKPQLGHTVVVCGFGVAGHMNAMALHKPPEARNTSADWAVHVLPVVEELFVGHPGLLGDAVDELDHAFL